MPGVKSSFLKETFEDLKYLVAFLVMFALAFMGGLIWANMKNARLLDEAQDAYDSTIEDLEVSKNQLTSLERLIADLESQNGDLAELLRTRKSEIKYVIKEKIVLVGSEDKLDTLPDYYLYKLNEEIPVGIFEKQEDGYLFKTYDLTFYSDVVVTNKETFSTLTIQSSADEMEFYTVPLSTTVYRIREQAIFEPQIGVGISGNAPAFDIAASIYAPMIHPSPAVDVLVPRLSVSMDNVYLGLDIAGYNFGEPMPLLTDAWIYGGVSTTLSGEPQATITIGSKL